VDQQGETELARSLLAGESNAFERFVKHFQGKVFHYSWLMCASREDAEEVAQETLTKIFENFDQLRDPARVRAWVFRIARNACLMQRRKSIFAPAHELSLEELAPGTELPEGSEAPEATVLRNELLAVVDRAIAELPAVYRPVVLLRDLEELTTEETAEILDLSTDVVKTRLHRGRRALREKLDCYLYNHCLDDAPAPNPTPLTGREREELYAVWRKRVTSVTEPASSKF
jgi:RNA polymerase sigma-70 factor (ECF subfamily)